MNYELWDTEIGNGLARFGTARDMASLVDGLVAANGKPYAAHLSLVIEKSMGDQCGFLTGTDLVAWAWGVRNAPPDFISVPS